MYVIIICVDDKPGACYVVQNPDACLRVEVAELGEAFEAPHYVRCVGNAEDQVYKT